MFYIQSMIKNTLGKMMRIKMMESSEVSTTTESQLLSIKMEGDLYKRGCRDSWTMDTVNFLKKNNIQGVSKKTHLCVWQAIEGTRSGLQTKVGWVLKNSGNFLSNEHKNSSFLSENDWEKWAQRCLPPMGKGMLVDHTKDHLPVLPFQWKVD